MITKNIVIYNQQDADKLQGKRVTGKTLLYFSEDLTLSNVDFEGEVIAIPIEQNILQKQKTFLLKKM